MSKGPEQYVYTQNRELSWLNFNQRVLEEAADESVPLIERLKFVSIFTTNLDEFFRVRVGSLFDVAMVSPEETDNKTGMNSAQQLECIYQRVPDLIDEKHQIYDGVMKALAPYGIIDATYEELSAVQKREVQEYFRTSLLPILSPIIISSHHPVPHLVNKDLYIAVHLANKKGKESIGLVPVPDSVPPYFPLKDSGGTYIRAENIVLEWVSGLFGAYRVLESCVISVTRNADISFDDEKFEDNDDDFRDHVTKLLKKREYLSVMRLEIGGAVSDQFAEALRKLVSVEPKQTYVDLCPLNMKYVFMLADDLSPAQSKALLYAPYKPRWPESIDADRPMMEQIRKRDRLLFYPYDSVDPFLRLLNEAAEDPNVMSIKITLYRMASYSKIAQALCRAADNGKEVLALIELRARFDEANNVAWSKMMEEAGCQIIYGIEDYKCHSKICLITMKSREKVQYITQVGTGNYNEKTNKLYTDLCFMTASQSIGEDGTVFFQNMLVNNLQGEYRELLVSPKGIKNGILENIDRQIALGADGYVCIKANSITEREVIDKLQEASAAGVKIELIIRSICCLLPGLPGLTENIQITSIVGRYLEHARIYCFGRGDEAVMYISSADLMTRNLNRRVEVACPVRDPRLREMLQRILKCQLSDNKKASFIQPDGTYLRKHPVGAADGIDSQDAFMKESLHKPGTTPLMPHEGRKGKPEEKPKRGFFLFRLFRRNR